jgi:hypothetical protein
MKCYASVSFTALALLLTAQAHAVMPSDQFAGGSGTSASNGPTVSPQLGGNGGTDPGGGINPVCTGSPENATVLLAVISGMGLLLGRQMYRIRGARPESVPAQ